MDNDEATQWAGEMAHEANEAEWMAALKASALVTIQDGTANTIEEMMEMFNDPKAGGTPVVAAELDEVLLVLRQDGKIKLGAEGVYTEGMETMYALMLDVASALQMPVDGELFVGPLGFSARTDSWAGEIRVTGDGIAVTVEQGRARLSVVAGYAWRTQAFGVEASVHWTSVGSVSPEDASTFACQVAQVATWAEVVRDLLAPLAKEAREPLSLATERWLAANEAVAMAGLRARLAR